MKNSIKNIVVCVVFCLFVFGFFVACIFHKPLEYSESERKPLAQFPKISIGTVLDKTAISGFDKYSAEQFPLREQFLDLYRWYRRNIFKTMHGILLFGVFIATWIPINILCMFKKNEKWTPVKHICKSNIKNIMMEKVQDQNNKDDRMSKCFDETANANYVE